MAEINYMERAIFEACHGLIDFSKCENLGNNWYDTSKVSFSQFSYFDGFTFLEYNPMIMGGTFQTPKLELQNEHIIVQEVNEMIKNKKYVDYFLTRADKKVGLKVLVDNLENIPKKNVYDSFIAIYQRSEFGFEILKEHYDFIFSTKHYSKRRETRLKAFIKKQKELGLKPDDEITIYNGESIDNPVFDYYSWTTSRDIAKRFAYRWSDNGFINEIDIKINSDEIIDYLDSRNEEEIIRYYARK